MSTFLWKNFHNPQETKFSHALKVTIETNWTEISVLARFARSDNNHFQFSWKVKPRKNVSLVY